MKWFQRMSMMVTVSAIIVLVLKIVIKLLDVCFIPTDALHTANAQEVVKGLGIIRQEGIGVLLLSLLQSAFSEEIMFRFFPFFIFAKWITSHDQVVCTPSMRTIAVVLIASLYFGLVHGSVWCILSQGILGIALSVVFITATHLFETGIALGRFKKALIALVVSTIVHTYYNFLIVV